MMSQIKHVAIPIKTACEKFLETEQITLKFSLIIFLKTFKKENNFRRKLTSEITSWYSFNHQIFEDYLLSATAKNWQHLVLKSDSKLPKICFYLLQWNPFKYDGNAFYFLLKAIFVLQIFTLLLCLFGFAGKQLDKKAMVNFKNYDV